MRRLKIEPLGNAFEVLIVSQFFLLCARGRLLFLNHYIYQRVTVRKSTGAYFMSHHRLVN